MNSGGNYFLERYTQKSLVGGNILQEHIDSKGCSRKINKHNRFVKRISEERYKNKRGSIWRDSHEVQQGPGRISIQVKYDILIFLIKELRQMVTRRGAYVVILITD